MAADAGAHAVKLQTYTADTITLDVDTPDFRLSADHPLWGSRRLYDLYDEAHTPWEWHEPVFELARERGILAFSSPFDPTAVSFLADLDVPAYKIASSEIVDLPLVRTAAAVGRPMVISTGMASLGEIAAAVDAARSVGNDQIILLSATVTIPPTRRVQPARMPVPVGVRGPGRALRPHDGHRRGGGIGRLRRVLIEKHVTMSRDEGGVDSASPSSRPSWRHSCVSHAPRGRPLACPASGHGSDGRDCASAGRSRSPRTSGRGTSSPRERRSIRPAGGLAPDDSGALDGRRFARDTARGTRMSWDLVT